MRELINTIAGLTFFASIILLIIGLIRPSVFSKILKAKSTRGRISLIFGGTAFIAILVGAIVSPNNSINSEEKNSNPKSLFKVTKVTDGDTIEVDLNGKVEKIRLIGIDTPETLDPRKPVQCFGIEASNHAKELLEGKQVYLEKDTSQGDRDKYDRLLRYVEFQDGTSFNKSMISDGYAHEYTYDKPYKYQSDYKNAEKVARDTSRGLWSQSTCSGLAEKPTPTASPSTPTPANTVTPTPSATQAPVVNSEVYYANCTAVRDAGAAPLHSNQPGYRSALDRDNDGVACE